MFNNDNITIKMDKETFLKERNAWDNQKLVNSVCFVMVFAVFGSFCRWFALSLGC
jgi:O-antigen ligase